jgi:hypothetical protein
MTGAIPSSKSAAAASDQSDGKPVECHIHSESEPGCTGLEMKELSVSVLQQGVSVGC